MRFTGRIGRRITRWNHASDYLTIVKPQTSLQKYPSINETGVFFYAKESVGGMWAVMSQSAGFPELEAHDDWFATFEDADAIAQLLAKGEGL